MTISIPDEVLLKPQERASVAGKPLPAYTAQLVFEAVSRPSIDEILAPVREDFAKTGMSESELLELGRDLLNKVRRTSKA